MAATAPDPRSGTRRLPTIPALTERPELGQLLDPRRSNLSPRHGWWQMGHAYSSGLVEHCPERWQLPASSVALDPFCGSGTTLLAASARSFATVGVDLSPLAVLASTVKTASLDACDLRRVARRVASARHVQRSAPSKPIAAAELFPPAAFDDICLAIGVAAQLADPALAGALRLASPCLGRRSTASCPAVASRWMARSARRDAA